MTWHKNQTSELDIMIARLELEKKIKLEELKEQLAVTSESIKPINIIKDTFQDFKHSPDLKSNLLQTAVGITGGYLSKKLLFGKSKSFFKKTIANLLQYGVAYFISKKVKT